MAIKYFCDGCDDEILHTKVNTVRWSFIGTDQNSRELCDNCFKRFDPKKWPRHPKPKFS